VTATTVTVPDPIQQTTGSLSLGRGDGPDPIQWPTAHLSSEPDIVELKKINHNEPNEATADTY